MAEGIDVRLLGERLRRVRLKRNKTLKEVAEATNVSVATLSRIERLSTTEIGSATLELGSTTLLAITHWIGTPVEKLKENPVAPSSKTSEETPDIVELYLRADKRLDRRTATGLAKMFRAAYDEFSKSTRKTR